MSSNGLPEKRHSHIGCICLTFLHCEFSNVSSNGVQMVWSKYQFSWYYDHWYFDRWYFDIDPIATYAIAKLASSRLIRKFQFATNSDPTKGLSWG